MIILAKKSLAQSNTNRHRGLIKECVYKPEGGTVTQETFNSNEEQAVLPPDLKDRLVRFINETYGKSVLCADLRNRYLTAVSDSDILELLDLSEKVGNSVAYWGEKLDRKERDALYGLDADLKKWLDESTR